MRSPLATIIAILTSLVVILATFFRFGPLTSIRTFFLDWAITIGAFALLIGILNLTSVHWRKIYQYEKRDYYSIAFFLGFLLTIIFGILFEPSSSIFTFFTSSIMTSVETSLMALLSLSLAVASFKFFQKKLNLIGIIFIFSALIFLISLSGFLTISDNIPFIRSLLSGLNLLPVAGARGILIGISLGALVTGLRVLMGFDKPYSG